MLVPEFEKASGHKVIFSFGAAMGNAPDAIPTRLARGEAELGVQQVSELVPINGIDYIGPLPEEVQQNTLFSAGIVTGAKAPEAAREMIKFFTSTTAAPIIAKTGLTPMTVK